MASATSTGLAPVPDLGQEIRQRYADISSSSGAVRALFSDPRLCSLSEAHLSVPPAPFQLCRPVRKVLKLESQHVEVWGGVSRGISSGTICVHSAGLSSSDKAAVGRHPIQVTVWMSLSLLAIAKTEPNPPKEGRKTLSLSLDSGAGWDIIAGNWEHL